MFEFFTVWLLVIGAAMTVAGTVMVLIVGTPLFSIADRLLDGPFWPAGTDATTKHFQAWAYSVTFATMAGWGLTIAMIAANAFGSHQVWAWWSIAAALALWYPLDTARSLYHRVYANAILNTVLLAAVAIPLAFTFGEFH